MEGVKVRGWEKGEDMRMGRGREKGGEGEGKGERR